MKKLLLLTGIAVFTFACSDVKKDEKHDSAENTSTEEVANEMSTFYGEAFEYEQPVLVSELTSTLSESDSTMVIAKGKVVEVCQAKGCWMTLELPNSETMRVTFKDYGFFVPKDLGGKEVVLKGKATISETDVETLQHLAADAGKSEEEIAKITEPEKGYAFLASGVTVVE
jgi:hypothetical protein